MTKLRNAWLRFYYKQCAHYPPRWYWPLVRIFGGSTQSTCYMTRAILTPMMPEVRLFGKRIFRGGQYYLHVFHREDLDRDPHDHPFPFRTIPVNVGYTEDVYYPRSQCWTRIRVPRWRWSARPATHTHRVINTDTGRWPLVTIVWRGSSTGRKWGFWVHNPERLESTERRHVVWSDYIYGGEAQNANLPGLDIACPGTPRRD